MRGTQCRTIPRSRMRWRITAAVDNNPVAQLDAHTSSALLSIRYTYSRPTNSQRYGWKEGLDRQTARAVGWLTSRISVIDQKESPQYQLEVWKKTKEVTVRSAAQQRNGWGRAGVCFMITGRKMLTRCDWWLHLRLGVLNEWPFGISSAIISLARSHGGDTDGRNVTSHSRCSVSDHWTFSARIWDVIIDPAWPLE